MTDEKTIEARAKLGRVSGGQKTTSVRASVTREDMTLEEADHVVQSQLRVSMEIDHEADEQGVFEEMAPKVNGVVEVHTVTMDSPEFKFTMSFNTKALGREGKDALDGMAEANVKMTFIRIGDASQGEGKDGEAEGGAADDGTGNMFDDADAEPDPEAWKREPVTSLKAYGVKQGTVDALAQHDVTTLGELQTCIAHGQGWHRDMKGIGDQAVEAIESAMPKWFAQNSHKCPPVGSAA